MSNSLSSTNDAVFSPQLSEPVPPSAVKAAQLAYAGSSLAAHTAVRLAGQFSTGAVSSTTVTTAMQLAVLFDASVAVRITMFWPRSSQSNVPLSMLTVTPGQLSLLLLFTSEAATIAPLRQ
ncbi:MAG: hypothetical protein IPM81_20385 [Saprospirales bacterium]|nr:hypothetical protein [Saprospirales bacterium]